MSKFKELIFSLVLVAIGITPVSSETYGQCKRAILNELRESCPSNITPRTGRIQREKLVIANKECRDTGFRSKICTCHIHFPSPMSRGVINWNQWEYDHCKAFRDDAEDFVSDFNVRIAHGSLFGGLGQMKQLGVYDADEFNLVYLSRYISDQRLLLDIKRKVGGEDKYVLIKSQLDGGEYAEKYLHNLRDEIVSSLVSRAAPIPGKWVAKYAPWSAERKIATFVSERIKDKIVVEPLVKSLLSARSADKGREVFAKEIFRLMHESLSQADDAE